MTDTGLTKKAEPLKRLGGGRWQTRDERFTIEPQSGTWVIVDAEQTDDLGLPLVRGPFSSLTAAKDAIETARDSEPSVSPLGARAEQLRQRPTTTPAGGQDASATSRARPSAAASSKRSSAPAEPPEPAPAPEPPPEPRWLTDLDPNERRRARRLITALDDAGAKDAEGIARRDIDGNVPAAAAFAVVKAVAALRADAGPRAVAATLADGQDKALGVRWRLVDGEGRPITLDPEAFAKR